MIDRNALRGACDALRADLSDPTAGTLVRPGASPARPVQAARAGRTLRRGERLPESLGRVLTGLVRRHPDETAGRIVARFLAATGVRVTESSVRSRRTGPGRPEWRRADPGRPLTADEGRIVADLLEAHPEASAARIAALAEAAVGRRVERRAVLRREPGRKAYPSAAWWPAWTDAVAFEPAWGPDDLVLLGPASRAQAGGAR